MHRHKAGLPSKRPVVEQVEDSRDFSAAQMHFKIGFNLLETILHCGFYRIKPCRPLPRDTNRYRGILTGRRGKFSASVNLKVLE